MHAFYEIPILFVDLMVEVRHQVSCCWIYITEFLASIASLTSEHNQTKLLSNELCVGSKTIIDHGSGRVLPQSDNYALCFVASLTDRPGHFHPPAADTNWAFCVDVLLNTNQTNVNKTLVWDNFYSNYWRIREDFISNLLSRSNSVVSDEPNIAVIDCFQIEFNSLTNYLVRNWVPQQGCLACRENTINLNSFSVSCNTSCISKILCFDTIYVAYREHAYKLSSFKVSSSSTTIFHTKDI